MNNHLFKNSDYTILGGKALVATTGNRRIQNTVDAISLGGNAYGYMQANSRLAYLERQLIYSNVYDYQNFEIEKEINYYRNQKNKHIAMGIIDVFSLVCRNLLKN